MRMLLRRRLALLTLAAGLIIAGCGAAAGDPATSADPDGPAATSPEPIGPVESVPPESAGPSGDPTALLCEGLVAVQGRVTDLAALELRPTSRVTLDIELSRVQVAFTEMRQDALDALELGLDDEIRRLGYRLDDLALAVEDFRTTSRPREAARHVATDAEAFADALAGFELQLGC